MRSDFTKLVKSSESGQLFEVVGAVHLHSDWSDGTLPIPEIAEIGEQKGLDFLMFTDHHTLESKRKGFEGWYNDILVIIGYEINDPDDRNHYLAFRIDEEIEPGLCAAEYVEKVKEKGGVGIIAHPAEKRNIYEAYPPYPWTEWNIDGFNGIEIWNQLSEWMEGVTRSNIFWRIMHPLRSIRFPVWEILHRWDELNRNRRVVGIGGIDVHAFRIKLLGLIPLEIYPYKVQFKSIRTHFLTEKPLKNSEGNLPFKESERQIFRAFRFGRCFISNYYLGDARGFKFKCEISGKSYDMGSRIRTDKSMKFFIKTPLPGSIRLLRNGRVIKSIKGSNLSCTLDAGGVYRVEVFRRKKGWIYSNPFVIKK